MDAAKHSSRHSSMFTSIYKANLLSNHSSFNFHMRELARKMQKANPVVEALIRRIKAEGFADYQWRSSPGDEDVNVMSRWLQVHKGEIAGIDIHSASGQVSSPCTTSTVSSWSVGA